MQPNKHCLDMLPSNFITSRPALMKTSGTDDLPTETSSQSPLQPVDEKTTATVDMSTEESQHSSAELLAQMETLLSDIAHLTCDDAINLRIHPFTLLNLILLYLLPRLSEQYHQTAIFGGEFINIVKTPT